MLKRIATRARDALPTRERMEQVRLVRPLAARAELWRFTRRSVPRGVAVGLLVGILALIPGVQIAGAALLCVPLRANIPVSAAMTFLSNPATTPFIVAAALSVGNRLGFHADLATFGALIERGAGLAEWARWLVSDAAPALLFGLSVLGLAAAVVGYAVTVLGWRWWTVRKRRVRLSRAAVPETQA